MKQTGQTEEHGTEPHLEARSELAPVESSFVDQALWSRLTQAPSADALARAWLEIQCRRIDGVERAVVVLGPADRGPFEPIAHWPAGAEETAAMRSVAEMAMEERRGAARGLSAAPGSGIASSRQGRLDDGVCAGLESGPENHGDRVAGPQTDRAMGTIAFPILVDDRLHGVVAMTIAPRADAAHREVMRELQWGCAWLEAAVRRGRFGSRERLSAVLDLTALALEHPEFQASASAVVTELATALGCDWVGLGFVRRRHVQVRVISHSAEFGERSNLIRAIGLAMEEAVDQRAVLVYPAPSEESLRVVHAQAELTREHGAGALCTIPWSDGERASGAMMLKRSPERPFDPDEVEYCRHLVSVVGPVLEVRRREDRWLLTKAWDALAELGAKLVGRRHVGLKLAAAAAVAMVVFLSLASGSYRISAPATLEGTVQRAVTAPMDGYVESAAARAGEVVRAGEELARLDDKSLRIERVQAVSRREQRQRQYTQALAAGNRAEVRIVAAQIAQADAGLALLDEQLERTRILSPFDGLVVSGDLSQSLGVPVERGRVLFEVAPLDSYRVMLEVDEREIAAVRPGMQGEVALTGLTGQPLPMTVEELTPVSVAGGGTNFFEVEARLEQGSELLRPGMQGIGKIHIEERRLVWIWTHKLWGWLRLWVWSWWP